MGGTSVADPAGGGGGSTGAGYWSLATPSLLHAGRSQESEREIGKLTSHLCPEIREGVVSNLLEFERRGEIASENEGSEGVNEEGYLGCQYRSHKPFLVQKG